MSNPSAPSSEASAAFVEIKLGELGRRYETANFLLMIVSGIFVFLALSILSQLVVWAVVTALTSAEIEDSLASSLLWLASSLLLSLPAGLFLLWAIAIARMWRWGIFISAALFAVAWIALEFAGKTWSLENYAGSIIQALFYAVWILFLLQLVAGAWRLARTADNDIALLTAVPDHALTFSQTLANAMGISGGCRWMPSGRRRFGAALLFILASATVGLANVTILFHVTSTPGSIAAATVGPCPEVENFFDLGCRPRMFIFAGVLLVATAGLLVLSVLFRMAARKLARVSLENLEMSDARARILFLRSFQDDQVLLNAPKRSIFERLFAFGEPRPMLDHLLVEEGSALGPVIAIGMPSKPAPFGAQRIFFDDQTWQSAVRDLASQAVAIVIVADNTPGVHWELAHIRDFGHVQKTLYLLPPRMSSPDQGAPVLVKETQTMNKLESNIIGWYQNQTALNVLTDEYPSSSSYVMALRLFIRSRIIKSGQRPIG